jgi:hypothetical protein
MARTKPDAPEPVPPPPPLIPGLTAKFKQDVKRQKKRRPGCPAGILELEPEEFLAIAVPRLLDVCRHRNLSVRYCDHIVRLR